MNVDPQKHPAESRNLSLSPSNESGNGVADRLGDLVDFEFAVQQAPTVDSEVGRRIRDGLRGSDRPDLAQRRWGLKEWLLSKKRGAGAKVVSVTRLGGLLLFVGTFLLGVGVIRGLVTTVSLLAPSSVKARKGGCPRGRRAAIKPALRNRYMAE